MITRIALTLITVYQHLLSALMGSRCRFYPSCSQYTKEAIEHHGLLKVLTLVHAGLFAATHGMKAATTRYRVPVL